MRWRIGSIDIVRVADDDFVLPTEEPLEPWCVDAGLTPAVDQLPIAFSVLAIRSGDLRIVVDPWLANDAARMRSDALAHVERLLDDLASEGFPADEVDLVVNSHIDGIGWNTRPLRIDDDPTAWVPTFPKARYLFPAVELADAEAGHHANEWLAPLRDAGVIDPIDEVFTASDADQAPIALAPGVSIANAPGHNRGHVAVRFEDGSALAIYAGHLFLTPYEISVPRRADDEDPNLAEGTRRRILDELAGRGGLLLTTLVGGTGGGRVRRIDGPDESSYALERYEVAGA